MLLLDAQILGCFAAVRSPLLDVLFGAVTWLGSLWLLGPLALAAVVLGGRAWWRLPLALLASSLSAAALKAWVGRARPDLYEALAALPAEPSWPSSHAAQAAAFAVAASVLAPARWRYRLAAGLLPLVVAVALSRLYLQLHWPSDVLAGLLLGGTVALLTGRALR